MDRSKRVSSILLRALMVVLTAFGFAQSAFAHAPSNNLIEFMDKAPVLFVKENQSRYFVQGRDKSLTFTRGGVAFDLVDGGRVDLQFIDCNPAAKMAGRDPAPTIVSRFQGQRGQWKAGLRTYSSLAYEDLWPGIDLVYRGTLDGVKYEFIIRPGADPSKIRMKCRGASLASDTQGRLQIAAANASLRDDAPIAWTRTESGAKTPVNTRYVTDGKALAFSVAAYDRTQTLVIDPAVLVYCGYIGPITDVKDMAVGPDGSVYLTGTATGATTQKDAYVVKVNWSGKSIDFVTYLGGAGNDYGRAIAVDAEGNIYLGGQTVSPPASFPLVVGPDLTFNGGSDAFVAKLSPTGTDIAYCGYIGGYQTDYVNRMVVDANGSAYVLGTTNSPAMFPVKIGPSLTFHGVSDAFIAKVNASGVFLDYCGYIGGSGQEDPYALCVDRDGCAYVAGDTLSTDFPAMVGPGLTFHGGDTDAFVAKISATGDRFVYSGFIGGGMNEFISGIKADAAGNLYFAGQTQGDLPAYRGPDLTFNGGYTDGFVGKVNSSGTGIEWCGYIGGDSFDGCASINPAPGGLVYITGSTESSTSTFPVKVGPDLTQNGGSDIFLACLREQDLSLLWCGYLGGSGGDGAQGILAGSFLYFGGMTDSTEATLPVKVGPGLTYKVDGTLKNGFVAKFNIAAFTAGDREWAIYR